MTDRIPSPPLNYDYSVVTTDTDHVATLLLDAKNEYNKQLNNHLRQPIFNVMKNIYNAAENICHQENTPENVLMVFQDSLAQIPKWNKQRRIKEYDEFLKLSKCEWFNELIKFTYVTHVKILTIVNKSRPGVKLSISIPSGNTFFHSVCITVARELWKTPYLFSKNVGGKYEYQKNIRLIEQIIDNSVDACIREHIPMKAILQDYLDSDISEPNAPKPEISPSTQKVEEPLTLPKIEFKNDAKPKSPIKLSKPHTKSIVSDESIEDFLDEPEDIPEKPELKLDDLDAELEPVDFNTPDEIVEELDMIETSIHPNKEMAELNNTDMELSEVSLNESNTKPVEDLPTTETKETILAASESVVAPDAANTEPVVEKTSDAIIEEFDIDSIPELNLNIIPTSSKLDVEDLDPSTDNNKPTGSNSAEDNKPVSILDMNEPGMEFKQPQVKKTLVVSDLTDDDLEEVSLESKVEEQRTLKKATPQAPLAKKEFTFFS